MTKIIPEVLSPLQAAAFLKLEILSGSYLVKLSAHWITQDQVSAPLAALCSQTHPILSDIEPLFAAYLKELGLNIPNKNQAAKIVLKIYLEKIIKNEITPYEGMTAINNDIYSKIWFDGCEKYIGEILGLEHMFTFYRELQDAADGSMMLYYKDLPKEEAIKKLTENLKDEAKKLLDKLNSDKSL